MFGLVIYSLIRFRRKPGQIGDGIALEGNISKWWAKQTYKVAHGEGLFCHLDEGKHGK